MAFEPFPFAGCNTLAVEPTKKYSSKKIQCIPYKASTMKRNLIIFNKLWIILASLLLVLFTNTNLLGQNAKSLQGTIIVGNKSGNTVSFIDRSSGQTITNLPTGKGPHEVEVSEDGRRAVVANYGGRDKAGNSLSVYDVEKGRLVKTIDLGRHTRPHGLDWLHGTSRLAVTTEGTQSLLIVDVKKAEVTQTLNTNQEVSHMVAVTPNNQRAFVSSIRTGNVTVFDLSSGERLGQLYSGKGAEGIAVSPDGREVWVTNRADNTISVFDTQSLEKTKSLPCGDFPIRSKFSPNGKYFVVSNAQSGEVAVYDAPNKKLLKKIKLRPPVPEDRDAERYFSEFEGTSVPIGVVVPDNKYAYVSNTRSDVVTEIDLEKMEIVRHLKAGKEPDGIHFSRLSIQ